MRIQPLLFCSLFGLALSGGAVAQTPSGTGKAAPGKPSLLATAPAEAVTAKARELYAEGVKAFREQRWPEAYAAFVGAWALNKHYSIAGNLGAVELELGKQRDAAEHLAIYVREISKDQKSTPEERDKGVRAYERAKNSVLAVKVTVNAAGADVRLDSQLVGTTPLVDPVFVEPGKHSLEVRAADHITDRREVEGGAGEMKEAAFVLVKVPVSPSASAAPAGTTAAPGRSVVPAYVLGGVGAASLIAGAALVGASVLNGSDMLAEVPLGKDGQPTCRKTLEPSSSATAECDAWRARGVEAGMLGNVGSGFLVVAGIAAAGVAGYLLWPSSPPPRSATLWRISPLVSVHGGGALLEGRF